MPIRGLRHACESISRLPQLAEFGRSIGIELERVLMDDLRKHQQASTIEKTWVHAICNLIGNLDQTAKPPAEAVDGFRSILVKRCNAPHADPMDKEHCSTNV